MKENLFSFRKWLFPKTDPTIDSEIDTLNIRTIYYVSIAVCIVQILAMGMLIFTHLTSWIRKPT